MSKKAKKSAEAQNKQDVTMSNDKTYNSYESGSNCTSSNCTGCKSCSDKTKK